MFVEGKHEGDGLCICRKKLWDIFHRFVTNVEFKFEDRNTCGYKICVFKVLVAQWFDTCCGSKLSKSCQNHSYLLLSKDHRNLNSCNTFNFSIGVKRWQNALWVDGIFWFSRRIYFFALFRVSRVLLRSYIAAFKHNHCIPGQNLSQLYVRNSLVASKLTDLQIFR